MHADSALIHYGRCFKSGARTAWAIARQWIEDFPAGLREAHAEFLDLRDMHIAHSINDWELNIPVARVRVDQDTGKARVYAVNLQKSRVIMLSSERLDNLWLLAKTLGDGVQEEIEREQARLLEEHVKLIPEEELKRRIKAARGDFPGQRKVGNPRGRD